MAEAEKPAELAVVKYERPLASPVESVKNASLLLKANAQQMAVHITKAAGVAPDQVISTAITVVATAPPKAQQALLRCSGTSILAAVTDAMRYGLTFGSVLGQAYLVPFKGACQLIIGYRGLEEMAYRSGRVACISSGIVYEGEPFAPMKGTAETIQHVPSLNASHKPEKIVAAYATAILVGGATVVEVMNREDLNAIRARSKSGDFGPYDTDPAEMFRKAPIRRLIKRLPISADDRALLDKQFEAEDRVLVASATDDRPAENAKRVSDFLAAEEAGPAEAEAAPREEPGATEPDDTSYLPKFQG